ncbi:hypothetical protein NQ317_012834 [Molorchus minor]|uniref:Ig-like domain-containing protein n=1 Tax=Molorchus minor TaxID=1323400 RepID=A0ABQ9JAS0_9CUCU|nr:hypothetical protein NQ317_012834 [Molorchus minor]
MANAVDHNSEISNSKWVSRAQIKGPDAVYVQNGSPVTFTCEISPLSLQSGAYGLFLTSKPPVRWLHDGKEVSFEFQNNISIDTDDTDNDQRIFSTLHMPTVSWKDSGQYTCMQPSTKPASVKLFVVEGTVLCNALN